MTCTWLASATGNALFYFGIFSSILFSFKVSHPLILEAAYHEGVCNISSILFSISSCTCNDCFSSSSRFYCWTMTANYQSLDGKTVAETQVSPNLFSGFDSTEKECFITFRKDGYFPCAPQESMGQMIEHVVTTLFPNLKNITPYFEVNSSVSDSFSDYQQFDETSGNNFSCFYNSDYSHIILAKQIPKPYAAITPCCLLLMLAGLWLMKKYGTGLSRSFGKWFYQDFLLGIIAIPYNVLSCLAYVLTMIFINCFCGRLIPWTWDEYLAQGGMCCLCIRYYRTGLCPGWCPAWCTRTPESDIESAAATAAAPQVHDTQPAPADLPPSYSTFFKENESSPSDEVSLPNYSDLEGLPPMYDVVVNSAEQYSEQQPSQRTVQTESNSNPT